MIRTSGFTFVRNVVLQDYPAVESIRSMLPVCDQVVVAVGKSQDETLDLIRSIGDSRVKIIETEWDENADKGEVYTRQADIALDACDGDWCIYLQADEVLHEADYERFAEALFESHDDPRVEALLMEYLHFYGNYEWIAADIQWYRREIRAFRNTGDICSWGYAHGFRRKDGNQTRKLRARPTSVRVFHYGWVRHPKGGAKRSSADGHQWKLEGSDDGNGGSNGERFDYDTASRLERYSGTHPDVMKQRIASSREWADRFDPSKLKTPSLKIRAAEWIERATGMRVGEDKNYTEIERAGH